MRHRVLMAAILTVGCVVSSGHAALMISFEADPVPAQGTGNLDVYITPDANVNLAVVFLGLTIDEPFGVDSTLEFLDPRQPYELDPNYVFFNAMPDPVGDVPGPADQGIVWVGSDSPADPVELQAGVSYLIARIALVHSSIPPPDWDPVGNRFTISVTPGATEFLDDGFEIIDLIPPQSLEIEIQPAATAAIPEPGTWLMFAGLACAILPPYRRRRHAVRAG